MGSLQSYLVAAIVTNEEFVREHWAVGNRVSEGAEWSELCAEGCYL